MKKYFRFFVIFLVLSCWILHITSAQVVNIPDANLAALVRESLNLAPNAPITKQAMENLNGLLVLDSQVEDLTGLEHATELVLLGLFNGKIQDLRPLAGLTKLWSIGLGSNQIRDISPLAGLTQLEELYLDNNQVRDISPLARLTQLRELWLARNQISNIGSLARLTRLKTLILDGNQISNISSLANLTQLERLDLWHNRVSDVSPLARLTGLQDIDLRNNQIRDVRLLAGLTQLVRLGLTENQIRDASPLSGLTKLVVLFLGGNQITDVSPLTGLVNLERLQLAGNPITDTSPLASLTKLVEVDVEITAPLPDPLPDPLPEDPLPEDPLPEDPLPSPEPEPAPEPPPLPTITAGQITFSEVMYATSGGLFSQPQWIELYNNAPITTEPVNLRGSRLVIEARDSETRHRYSVIEFEDLHIAPNWTVLLVTRSNSRDSGYLSEERVYNLYDHSNVSNLGLRENAVLPTSGFSLKLLAADGTLVDSVGNLDGRKRTKDTPAWELPSGWMEDRVRTSLIRRYEDGTALPGTEAMSWVRAADVQLTVNTYYGRETDVGTPGYRRGGPLPVELSQFRSEQTDAGVSIEWTTESETDNAGFNILRAQTKDGAFVKVNPTLIPGAGTTAERNNYTWTDTTAKPNVAYYYRIEDVSFSGNRQSLATVQMRGYVSASDKLTTTWSELKVQD